MKIAALLILLSVLYAVKSDQTRLGYLHTFNESGWKAWHTPLQSVLEEAFLTVVFYLKLTPGRSREETKDITDILAFKHKFNLNHPQDFKLVDSNLKVEEKNDSFSACLQF